MLPWNAFDVLTFDCYGTLIDWEAGLWEALRPILTRHGVEVPEAPVLELYGELEAQAEQGEYREYKTVLRQVLEGLGNRLSFTPMLNELEEFSVSVQNWPAFPDSARALQALKVKYKLAVISNVDDDLFVHSARRLQVPLDWIITAQQARSYKPSHNNFHVAFERIGVPRNRILHVAQSLYHDIAPAKALGLATVWVDRRHDQAGPGAVPLAQSQPDLTVPDLETLGRLAGVLS